MNMMNKRANCKFHVDIQAVADLDSFPRAWLNFRRQPILCKTLYRKPIQASHFGGTPQLTNFSFESFSCGFHTRCFSTSTAWCSGIGSLRSLDAPELHASVTSENQFHCTCTRLYTMVQLNQKWPKTQIKGGPALFSLQTLISLAA